MFAKDNLFISSQMRKSIVQAFLNHNKTYGNDKNLLQEQRDNKGV